MIRLWVRLYCELPNAGKVQRLPDHLFRFLINCWCLTGASEDDTLPKFEEIAWRLRVDEEICKAYLSYLESIGLIEKLSDGRLRPHDWKQHQFISDDSKKRVSKYRKKKKLSDVTATDRYSNGDVTLPDSDSDSDSEQKQKTDCGAFSNGTSKTNLLDESWPKFQQAYPGVTATPEDWGKAAWGWRQLDWEQRAAAIEAVARSEPAFVKLPQNYLADREWTRKPRPEPVRKSALDKTLEEARKIRRASV